MPLPGSISPSRGYQHESEAVLGTERLVKYSLIAGERALSAYAWEESQSHFERGLEARAIPVADSLPLSDAEAAARRQVIGYYLKEPPWQKGPRF